ncbi:chaperone NapD [Vibrio hibernica]|uniref:chaperone NapD n=1 Tax=Vibrio hibernica TaxID=2587465 RepID=UPI0039B04C18
MALNEVHISSLVVHVVPKHLTEIKTKIESLDGVEIYGESEAGKLVVVVETQNQGYITDTIDVINNLEHVLNVALIFHQIESDLEDDEMSDTQFVNAE